MLSARVHIRNCSAKRRVRRCSQSGVVQCVPIRLRQTPTTCRDAVAILAATAMRQLLTFVEPSCNSEGDTTALLLPFEKQIIYDFSLGIFVVATRSQGSQRVVIERRRSGLEILSQLTKPCRIVL
jgi:hypothetical protein